MTDAFDLDGDDRRIGAVCIHGFTGSPYELRYLGERLAYAGIGALGIRLPGHGTSIDDLDRTRWQDWAAAVDAAVTTLGARYERVAVVGQSLGGLLALHAAASRPDIACVASLAAPLWLGGLAGLAARYALRLGLTRLPKLGGSDVRDPRVRAANPSYPAIPTRALAELSAFMRVVDDELPRVAQPVLVLHAAHDHTAPVACAARIATRTRAQRVRILPRSYHLIAVDVERDIVAAEVISLLQKQRGRTATCVT
ncbi:MAG: alpha/beta fold hydrolase [Proteobacteria bacterium]|nr:alpha/beta fold hydrolase [Pseudomonadota bacterium]